MVDLAIPFGETARGLGRPAFAIEFGAPSAGAGDLLSAVGDTLGLDLGGAADPWRESLLGLRVELGLAPFVNAARMEVAAHPGAPEVALGDEGSIALAPGEGEAQPVLSGFIAAIRRHADGAMRIESRDAGARLAALRVAQSYEQQGAGAIIEDLAQQAGVEAGAMPAGPELPFYVADGRRGAYSVIAELAALGGGHALVDGEGRLAMIPAEGAGEGPEILFGRDVIALWMEEREPALATLDLSGEGAAGAQGAEAWAWLAKDPAAIHASAGEGDPRRRLARRALRSPGSVGEAAAGLVGLAALGREVAVLEVPGDPALAPGIKVTLGEVPAEGIDGTYLVRSVRHRFDLAQGFRSRLWLNRLPEGGLGLGGLL